jgi:hypothetical protein
LTAEHGQASCRADFSVYRIASAYAATTGPARR